jgi:hypothetical protein
MAIADGRPAPHGGAHTQRAQQDRLVLREVVLGQQGLGREQARGAENVGVRQVSKEGAFDGVAGHAALGRHRSQHNRAIKGRVLGLAARGSGAGEERASQFPRILSRVLFKFAAVEHQFLQPAGQALLARFHVDGAAGVQQYSARLTDMSARKVEIGGGQFQRAGTFRFGHRNNDKTVTAPARMYEVSGKQCVRASAGW